MTHRRGPAHPAQPNRVTPTSGPRPGIDHFETLLRSHTGHAVRFAGLSRADNSHKTAPEQGPATTSGTRRWPSTGPEQYHELAGS
jgi:hypothetical protein